MNHLQKKPSVNYRRTTRNLSLALVPPFVEAAFHDEDNEGLLPVSALVQPVKVDLVVWDTARIGDFYQVRWNEQEVGDRKTITATDTPGNPLFLEIPTDVLIEGTHELSYFTINKENGVVEWSSSVPIVVDLTPPGRPQLGPMKFPPEIDGGLTSEELTALGDKLEVEIGSYTGMAKHDVIRTFWGNIEGPGAIVTADDMGLKRVMVTYSRAFLESLGKFNGVVSYDVTDRAGNISTRSLGVFVLLDLEELPANYPAPIIDPAVGSLIDYAEAKAGVAVDIPQYPGAAALDLITLHWGGQSSPSLPLPPGNEGENIVLSIDVPYDTIAAKPIGEVQVTYDVQRAGARVGSSLASLIDVFVTLPGPDVLDAPVIQGTSITNPNVDDNFIDEDDYELNGRAIITWRDGFEVSDDLGLLWGQEFIPQWYQIKASDVSAAKDLILPVPNTVMKAQGTGAAIPVRFNLTRFGNPNPASSPAQAVTVRSKAETPGGEDGLDGPTFVTNENGVVGPIENPNGAEVTIVPYVNILKDQTVQLTFNAFDNNNLPIPEANYQDERELDSTDVINGYKFRVPASNLKRICIGYGEASFKVIPPEGSNQSPATSRTTRVRINMSKPSSGCSWVA
jgi:hypothetical protein